MLYAILINLKQIDNRRLSNKINNETAGILGTLYCSAIKNRKGKELQIVLSPTRLSSFLIYFFYTHHTHTLSLSPSLPLPLSFSLFRFLPRMKHKVIIKPIIKPQYICAKEEKKSNISLIHCPSRDEKDTIEGECEEVSS